MARYLTVEGKRLQQGVGMILDGGVGRINSRTRIVREEHHSRCFDALSAVTSQQEIEA